VELVQYDGQDDAHYGWHTDDHVVSLTVQLSTADSYQGGELQLWREANWTSATREQGSVVLFLSQVIHRVLPVQHGQRFALVGWWRSSCGPTWRQIPRAASMAFQAGLFSDPLGLPDGHLRRLLWHMRGTASNALSDWAEGQSNLTIATEAVDGRRVEEVYIPAPRAYMEKARGAYYLGRPAEAVAFYNIATRLDPRYAMAYRMKGTVLFHQGRHRLAAHSLYHATQLARSDIDSWTLRARTLRQLARWHEAAEAWATASTLRPSAELKMEHAVALSMTGRTTEALASINRAKQLDLDEARIFANKVAALICDSNLDVDCVFSDRHFKGAGLVSTSHL